MFLEQILEPRTKNMLKWPEIASQSSTRGPPKTPNWYQVVKGKVTDDESKILEAFKKETGEPTSKIRNFLDKKGRPQGKWAVTRQENNLIIGKKRKGWIAKDSSSNISGQQMS